MKVALIIICVLFILSFLLLLSGAAIEALSDNPYIIAKVDDLFFKLFIMLFCGSIGAFLVLGVVALIMRVVNG